MKRQRSRVRGNDWNVMLIARTWRRVLVVWLCAAVPIGLVILGYAPSRTPGSASGSVSGTNRWCYQPGGGVRLIEADYSPVGEKNEGKLAWKMDHSVALLRGKIVWRSYKIDIKQPIDPVLHARALEGVAVMLGQGPQSSFDPFRNELRAGMSSVELLDTRALYEALLLAVVEAMALSLPVALWTFWVLVRRCRSAVAACRCVWCGHELQPTQYRCPECGELVITPEAAGKSSEERVTA